MTALWLTGEMETRIRAELFRLGLTERERDLCWRYIHGIPYQAMADEFGCNVQSVKFHLTEIKRKCGFDPEDLPATPIRMLRLLCGVAPRYPLVAA